MFLVISVKLVYRNIIWLETVISAFVALVDVSVGERVSKGHLMYRRCGTEPREPNLTAVPFAVEEKLICGCGFRILCGAV